MKFFTEEKVLESRYGYYKIDSISIELPCDDRMRIMVSNKYDSFMCNDLESAIKKANSLLRKIRRNK